ncbi:hypothetical protein Pse7429DRAFT_3612 [Pseudanabaena biceps PCC 7429]|uniref:Uncharacterized protein n=1 Tax=Pseudanabaena biceps PCC 7429 TaxID=927668 RepID=L8MUL5_9CYAN|nr:hypothetical protein Pse7429DRAFT_3612 [Pseudanabaena biceps PCC 7429]
MLIKTQELIGGAPRRQSTLGFYVLVRLTTAIKTEMVQCTISVFLNRSFESIYSKLNLYERE